MLHIYLGMLVSGLKEIYTYEPTPSENVYHFNIPKITRFEVSQSLGQVQSFVLFANINEITGLSVALFISIVMIPRTKSMVS
jgi:hypothetical protein